MDDPQGEKGSELRQIVHFHPTHFAAIADGEKMTTVRWHEDLRTGPSTFVFDGHPSARSLLGRIVSIERFRVDRITAAQARQPAGTDMRRFAEQLRENCYPGMPDDAVVEVAELSLDGE